MRRVDDGGEIDRCPSHHIQWVGLPGAVKVGYVSAQRKLKSFFPVAVLTVAEGCFLEGVPGSLRRLSPSILYVQASKSHSRPFAG